MQDHKELAELETVESCWKALANIKDPCCVLSGRDFSIVDLGLVNRVELIGGVLEVGITLTDIGCEFAHRIFRDIEALVEVLPGVSEVRVVPEILPMWTTDRLGANARAAWSARSKAFFEQMDRADAHRGRVSDVAKETGAENGACYDA